MNRENSNPAQQWYNPRDKCFAVRRKRAKQILEQLQTISQHHFSERKALLSNLLGRTGKQFYIESPFHCDYGDNISIGENFYANTGCIILDAASVSFGKNCMLGPNVNIYTSTHPMDAELRAKHLEASMPITIGDDVWIGGNATILPGVTIGDRAVIGAGSVVTRNIENDTVVAGNPARPLHS
jgi:maltose O-acetyltransferase